MKALLFAFLALLAICEQPAPVHKRSAQEDQVYQAWLSVWDLDEPDDVCRLEELTIQAMPTVESYYSLCPPNSWACARWRYDDGYVCTQPVAIINPELPVDRHNSVALHELFHMAGRCAHLWSDRYDYAHADLYVWEVLETKAKQQL